MKKPKISVIIPVYNVEKYLQKCLDSVVNQTLKELEIIIVNDGSTDSSLSIAEEFAKNDSRIKVVNKENGGVSSARNAGLRDVTGEYISFIDSDDWIDKTMYEKMYEAGQSEDTDIIVCNAMLYIENKKIFKNFCTHKNIIKKNNNSLIFVSDNKKKLFLNMTVCWNKLFKSKFYLENEFKFPEGYIYEEPPVLFIAHAKANKIIIVPESLYYYRQRAGSYLAQKTKKRFDVFNTYYLVLKALKTDYNYYNNYKDVYLNKMILGFFNHFMLIDKDYKKEFFEKACELTEKIEKEEIKFLNFYAYFKFKLFQNKMYRLSLLLTPIITRLDRLYFKLNSQ